MYLFTESVGIVKCLSVCLLHSSRWPKKGGKRKENGTPCTQGQTKDWLEIQECHKSWVYQLLALGVLALYSPFHKLSLTKNDSMVRYLFIFLLSTPRIMLYLHETRIVVRTVYEKGCMSVSLWAQSPVFHCHSGFRSCIVSFLIGIWVHGHCDR